MTLPIDILENSILLGRPFWIQNGTFYAFDDRRQQTIALNLRNAAMKPSSHHNKEGTGFDQYKFMFENGTRLLISFYTFGTVQYLVIVDEETIAGGSLFDENDVAAFRKEFQAFLVKNRAKDLANLRLGLQKEGDIYEPVR